MEFKDYIVKKPWGFEYLIYENQNINLWLLYIENNNETSLHCHPNKKTGLILLKGHGELSFLNNSFKIEEKAKFIIREGVFHSTKSMDNNGIFLIEIETPVDKYNLVRLDDKYGRSGKEYENDKSYIFKNNKELWLEDKLGFCINYFDYKFTIDTLNFDKINVMNDDDIIICLNDICIKSKNNFPITTCGDIVNIKTIKRILKEFIICDQSKVLYVEKYI